MADKAILVKKLGGAVIFGLAGYIIGYFLNDMSIFPALAWSRIGLFLGFIYGLFKDELEGLFT